MSFPRRFEHYGERAYRLIYVDSVAGKSLRSVLRVYATVVSRALFRSVRELFVVTVAFAHQFFV
jgi:hypothetical protein